MAAVPQRVLNWLYSVLTSEYQDVNRTYNDVAQTLSHYSSLSPRTDVYTYETGQPALLVVLSGTLPVNFRGTTYRFPLSIWVPHAYPREAPMVYVTPTGEIVVRPGQHVGGDGRCYHPYLANWAEFWSRSTILDLLAVLRDVFAKEPPVVSKQPPPQTPQIRQEMAPPPPVPPLPPELGSSLPPKPPGGPVHAVGLAAPPPPPPPPKPHETPEREKLQPPVSTSGPARGTVPPPIPEKPRIQYDATSAAYQNGYAQPTNMLPIRTTSLRNPGGPPPTIPSSTQQAQKQNRPFSMASPRSPSGQWPQLFPAVQQPRRQESTRYGNPQTAPLSPPGGLNITHQQPPAPVFQVQLPSVQQQLPQRRVPPSEDLLSSDLRLPLPQQNLSFTVPPPPIPPNPEKDYLLHQIGLQLRTLRQQSLAQTNSSLPALRAQHNALINTQHLLLAELNELKSLDNSLASNERILQDSARKADEVIASAAGREVPGVDEVLVAPTVVGGQLYELVCEERAVGDAMFVLGRALGRERIGVDVFLKQTRSLAREQFLRKALIKKIARGMNLIEDISRR
ncbi:MAG: hypothetical protein M1840_005489 [Geoglossum simile]|nr:MAG: hypothetical protein M1840_005489 [Geoglossum simile]